MADTSRTRETAEHENNAEGIMRVFEISPISPSSYRLVTRQGGMLLAHRVYTFSPEFGRCLPRFVTERNPENPKTLYRRIIDYFFG